MAKNSAATKGRSVTTAGSKKKKKRKSGIKYLHVVYHHREGWVVRTENYRQLSIHDTRREALEVARPLAKKKEITLVIYYRNGYIKKWERYNREPLPPPQLPKVLYPTDPPRTATREAIRRAVIEVINERRAKELKVTPQSGRTRKHATTSKAN